jgi:hypothetical protein
MSQMSKNSQPFVIDALSTNGVTVGTGANKTKFPGQELLNRVASDIKVAAHSTMATLTSDTNFAKQLQVGDIVISWQAAANQVETVVTNGTLPAGFSGTNLLAVAWRTSANSTN